MKSVFLPLLWLISIFYITSCGGYRNIEKKRNFELQMKSPMTKNITPAYVFFESSKKNKMTSNYSNETKYLGNNKRSKIVKYALKFKGKSRVKKDKKFRNDCSGFVRSIFDNFDVELYNTTRVKRNGNWLSGTEVIYNFIEDNGEIFSNKLPRIGDIIFFDNTTDRNRDGKVNDNFTHIAIVVNVLANGTIYYIHKSNRGINIQKMNLRYPNKVYIKNGKKNIKVNSYLRKRRKKDKKGTPYLSSQMFRAFGSIFKSYSLSQK